ncbi:MAG: DNA internalization-related competence protein ComEC/Rec2 [Lachnospiraceae bacterium]|nr:DNA internalization-related competence protein ComEC/Rec2 [Lachnospiraceae bacterium]
MAYLFPGRWSAAAGTAAALAVGLAGPAWERRRRKAAGQETFAGQRKRWFLLPFFLCACFILGHGIMTRALRPDPLFLDASEAGRAGVFRDLTGTVRDIRTSADGGFRIAVAGLEPEGSGAVLYAESLPDALPGDRVRIRGTFRAFERATNPGQFDRYAYYRAQGTPVFSDDAAVRVICLCPVPLPGAVFRIRQCLLSAADALADAFPGHSGDAEGAGRERPDRAGSGGGGSAAERWRDSIAVLKGMFLGERSLIPAEVRGTYSAGGIAHMLAISGLHLSLVGMRLVRFLTKRVRLDYPRSAGLSAAAVCLYCMLTGFTASSVRAMVMFSVMIFGEASSRPYDMPSALSLSGLILCLASPLQITQAGFQLSFLSAAAIALAAPAAEGFTQADGKEKGPVFGLCLQAVTLPAVSAHYFRVPAAAVLLNLGVVPVLPYLAAASFAAVTVSLVSPSAGAVLFAPAHLIFSGLRAVCGLIAAVPGMRILTGAPSFPKLAVSAAVLMAAAAAARRIAEREAERERKLNGRERRRRIGCLAALVLAMTASLCGRAAPGTGVLTITFLDVGQGDGIFVEFPSGATALIDCGSSDAGRVGTYRLEPFLDSLAVERPDMVFLTHLDEDHVSGIRELSADGRVPRIFLSEAFSTEKRDEKEAFIAELEEKGVEVTLLPRGAVWTDRSGARLTCVYPEADPAANGIAAGFEDENDTSLVLLLEYGEFSALFTGDLGAEREPEVLEMLPGDGGLDVLKTAHHGSAYSTGAEFLAALRPELAVISCDAENPYGHPSAETMARLEAAGARTVVTAEAGCVIVTADENGILDVRAPYRRS